MSGFPIPPLAMGQAETKELAAQAALKNLAKLADLESAPAVDGEPMWANQGRLTLKAALKGEAGCAWALEAYEINPPNPVDGYINAATEQVALALMTHSGLRNELQQKFRFLAVEGNHVRDGNKELTGAQSEAAWAEFYRALKTSVPLPVRNALNHYAWSEPRRSGGHTGVPLVHQIDWVAVLEDVMEEGFHMTREQSLRQQSGQSDEDAGQASSNVSSTAGDPASFALRSMSVAPVKTRSIEDDVLAVLAQGRSEGPRFFLPDVTLDRNLYNRVDEVLKALGGGWNRFAKAHMFEDDAAAVVETAVLTKSFVKPQDLGFFPTPDELADQLLQQLDVSGLVRCDSDLESLRVLEPSAGNGALVRAAMRRLGIGPHQVTCFEIHTPNIKLLKELGVQVIEADFLKAKPADFQPFDIVVMNPPFSNSQDVQHIEHACHFLHGKGQLAAISSPSWAFRSRHSASAQFRDLLSTVDARVRDVEAGAFKVSGTSVATKMIHLYADQLPWNVTAEQELRVDTEADAGAEMPAC